MQQHNTTNMFQPEARTNSSKGQGYLQSTKTLGMHVSKCSLSIQIKDSTNTQGHRDQSAKKLKEKIVV